MFLFQFDKIEQKLPKNVSTFDHLRAQTVSHSVVAKATRIARSRVGIEAKLVIAREAAKLVTDGESIFLDASTTVYYLAQQLSQYHRLRVLTNGIEVARLMAGDPTNTVVLMGGIINPEGSSVSGNLGEQVIRDLHVQKAFVSCSGFSLERGMTDVHLAEAPLKNRAIASAREVFALVDSSKMGKEDLTPFATIDQITHLYTDFGISETWVMQLKNVSVPFTVCHVRQELVSNDP